MTTTRKPAGTYDRRVQRLVKDGKTFSAGDKYFAQLQYNNGWCAILIRGRADFAIVDRIQDIGSDDFYAISGITVTPEETILVVNQVHDSTPMG